MVLYIPGTRCTSKEKRVTSITHEFSLTAAADQHQGASARERALPRNTWIDSMTVANPSSTGAEGAPFTPLPAPLSDTASVPVPHAPPASDAPPVSTDWWKIRPKNSALVENESAAEYEESIREKVKANPDLDPSRQKERRIGFAQTLYTKLEFERYYKGLNEWHAAASAGDKIQEGTGLGLPVDLKLYTLIERGRHTEAHDWLRERGCLELQNRELIINKIDPHLQQRKPKQPIAAPVDAPPKFKVAEAAIDAGEVAFVTLTNSGFLPYVANCLKSLDRLGEKLPLTVYCVDTRASERLLAAGYRQAHIVNFGYDDLSERTTSEDRLPWSRLMWLKCEVMRRALDEHEYVVFVDADVIFERPDAAAYCVELLATAADDGPQVLLQNGAPPGEQMKPDDAEAGFYPQTPFCAGVMAVRSTEATRTAFTVDEASVQAGWDDHSMITAAIESGQLRHQLLPLTLFPNMRYWNRHLETMLSTRRTIATRPFLAHFNDLIGAEKREQLRLHDRWYVGDEWIADDDDDDLAVV